jgi:hypothetical protein
MADAWVYRVLWSQQAIAALKDFATRAASDSAQALTQAVQSVDEKLRSDPLVVGEIYRSRGDVEERLGIEAFLAIDFAVDKARKLVLVRVCRSLSGHGL